MDKGCIFRSAYSNAGYVSQYEYEQMSRPEQQNFDLAKSIEYIMDRIHALVLALK